MNVQELISKCDRQCLFEEFAKRFCDNSEDIKDGAARRFYDFLDTLLAKTPIAPGDDIVCSEPTYKDGKIRYCSVAVSADDVRKFFRPLDFFDELESLAPEDITDDVVEPLLAKC